MSGRMSRNKGKRAEYLLRDHFRNLGYTSNRVPLSGASQGFKGDVTFSKDGVDYVAEVKSRKNSFAKIYEMYFKYMDEHKDDLLAFAYGGGESNLVNISTSLHAVMGHAPYYTPEARHPMFEKYSRTFRKVINMESLLGGADILVVKDDRMPLLFIRYL